MDTGWVLGHQCFWEPTGVTQQPGDLAGWWAQDLAPRLSPVLEARSWTPAGRCPPCVALNQLGPHRVPRTGLGQGQAHRLHPLQQPHTASPLPPPPAGAAIAAQEDGRPLWPLEWPPVPVSAQQGGCPAPPAMGRQEPCCGAVAVGLLDSPPSVCPARGETEDSSHLHRSNSFARPSGKSIYSE